MTKLPISRVGIVNRVLTAIIDMLGANRVLTAILVIAILGAIGVLGYVITTPQEGETFTEFYILGQEGKAADYPARLVVGEEVSVIVGIINHEGKEVSYRVEVVINDIKAGEVGPIVLLDEQKGEGELSFVLVTPGDNQKVEFLLYKNGEVEPYLKPLHLWVNARE
jgi:uncharacterized membrane protein